MREYYIPAGDGESLYTEKRSEFIGHVKCVQTEDEARAFITEMKKKYYDARHNCSCYIIKDSAERYSDDGEPQGTAGIPMLEVFRREGVSNVVCVVTRYFGGVLLGAGGLFRAYTKAAKDALDDAGVAVVRRWVEFSLPCSYSAAERMKNEVTALDGVVTDMEYAANVCIRALLPEENADKFKARIFDVSSGGITPEVTGEALKSVKIR